ncbi:MAG: ATP-grasp domain-containing protein [Propionibacteriales bacterium]|nr:ATP-grasp domain-containing protein [Propionibacteriales bacterium]
MTSISRLLVANRGEIASRVMRTAHDMDIATVAVFSDADADAPFVRHSDEAVHLPGSTATDTYLRADLLIEAARSTGADAVHPGYGFLSENADFARSCARAGLTFVGPPPEVLESMGSKTVAKEIMNRTGVPVLPGAVVDSEDDVDADVLAQSSAGIGYPVLVKAAYGGGGRGMRIVHNQAELTDAVIGARREASAAFGNGTVFLERYLPSPRHIEVQILGDTAGSVAHLFERECSIQRRYQKIIEEAPSPNVDDDLRSELGQAAVTAAKAIGYVGAGTVEFVLDETGQFYFLEMNTRLQVEHPVTELVTGLDLVHLQLLVAEGHPLPAAVLDAEISGHAIETRLYAEDVPAGFLPATGPVHRFAVPDLPDVRVDAGVADGSVVGVHYDPMLAKIIARGASRDEARRRLARALVETQMHGVVTNRDLLVGILREPEFGAGRTDTGYLSRHDPASLARSWQSAEVERIHATAAALAGQVERRAEATVLPTIPSGWRNVPDGPQRIAYSAEDHVVDVAYSIDGSTVRVAVNAEPESELVLRSAEADCVDLEVSGVRRVVSVHRVDDVSYVDSALGSTTLTEVPRFPDPDGRDVPGTLLAPMPGTVVRIAVETKQHVSAGSPVVVLEAMKMEHSVLAPHDGTVTDIGVVTGQAVDVGTVLAVVEEET